MQVALGLQFGKPGAVKSRIVLEGRKKREICVCVCPDEGPGPTHYPVAISMIVPSGQPHPCPLDPCNNWSCPRLVIPARLDCKTKKWLQDKASGVTN
jgi:hypothetical protein